MANHVTVLSPEVAALGKGNNTSQNVTDESEALQLVWFFLVKGY